MQVDVELDKTSQKVAIYNQKKEQLQKLEKEVESLRQEIVKEQREDMKKKEKKTDDALNLVDKKDLDAFANHLARLAEKSSGLSDSTLLQIGENQSILAGLLDDSLAGAEIDSGEAAATEQQATPAAASDD